MSGTTPVGGGNSFEAAQRLMQNSVSGVDPRTQKPPTDGPARVRAQKAFMQDLRQQVKTFSAKQRALRPDMPPASCVEGKIDSRVWDDVQRLLKVNGEMSDSELANFSSQLRAARKTVNDPPLALLLVHVQDLVDAQTHITLGFDEFLAPSEGTMARGIDWPLWTVTSVNPDTLDILDGARWGKSFQSRIDHMATNPGGQITLLCPPEGSTVAFKPEFIATSVEILQVAKGRAGGDHATTYELFNKGFGSLFAGGTPEDQTLRLATLPAVIDPSTRQPARDAGGNVIRMATTQRIESAMNQTAYDSRFGSITHFEIAYLMTCQPQISPPIRFAGTPEQYDAIASQTPMGDEFKRRFERPTR